jgi:hypothetical protein
LPSVEIGHIASRASKLMHVGSAVLAFFMLTIPYSCVTQAQAQKELKLEISVGHRAEEKLPFYVHLVPSSGVTIRGNDTWEGIAGAGHIETSTVSVGYSNIEIKPIDDMQVIWAYLLSHSESDTRDRLMNDPAARPDRRRVTFELNREGTRGFTVTMDQLTRQRFIWIPSLDVYLTTGESFAQAQKDLAQHSSDRILGKVDRAPEASYTEFKAKWEDMGNPAYVHPAQQGPGHVICITWDSAIHKFGIDRGAGVWSDYGNSDRFRFWFGFGDLADGIVPYWKSQRLQNGLPIITTTFEREGVRYEVEQFAYPLNGPPAERKGELNMVLLQRVRLTDISGAGRTVPVTMVHERVLPSGSDISMAKLDGRLIFESGPNGDAILLVNPERASPNWAGVKPRDEEFKGPLEPRQALKRVDVTLAVHLAAHGTQEFTVALPSPAVNAEAREALAHLDYDAARARTTEFWSSYLARGAQFQVPEEAVNDLFRANLWHALVLPRRHDDGQMDLPYSNFAYSQTGTPWPVNQAVYVDYMLYGLRGYNKIATEELEAIFRNNQQSDGHLGGNANWLAYTPGMLYAVAEDYLLSNDRDNFHKLLPQTIRALQWCLEHIRMAASEPDATGGLVPGELNDLTGSGDWAFNQAYLYAGVEAIGKALERDGDPRAAECLKAAEEFRSRIEHAMSVAAVLSPLVELRDHSWTPYVPSNASDPGRNFHQWYPSDVDTGAVHLLRFGALSAKGELADSLLNDSEDNLFLHEFGMANEPVYNQQATAYLLRDDDKAVIRAFYSMMACGFSQSVFEPVEHRWRWGQYFGPPSTDGAWFELYRNMVVRERDDDTLILGQATPRAWLQDGKVISVKDAPTWFGKISFDLRSHANTGTIAATVHLDSERPGTTVLLRLRHPGSRPLRGVRINGKEWRDFDAQQEWIRIPDAGSSEYSIVARY